MSLPSPARGRPSLAVTRRQEAISAFLSLIAERGLDTVTLDDVAHRAGMQRSVIRHYVGNRSELIVAALDELVDGYRGSVIETIGESPSIEVLLDYLFSSHWYRDQSTADRALDVLFREASRSEAMRDRLKTAYESLVTVVADALLRDARERSSLLTVEQAQATAYAIVCLAEHNVDLQSLGFDPSNASSALRAARMLATHPASEWPSS